MKSKIPSIIFRILTILTFLCGAVMFVHFIRAMIFAVQHEGAGDDPKFSGILGDIALFFYPFMIMTVLCIIFSIICFKAYHPAVSAIRTIFMAICLILDLISLKVMKAFILMDDLFNKGINKDLIRNNIYDSSGNSGSNIFYFLYFLNCCTGKRSEIKTG